MERNCSNCKFTHAPMWHEPCNSCVFKDTLPNWESDSNGKVESTDEMPDFQK